MTRVLPFVGATICFEATLYTVLAPLLPHFSATFALSEAGAGALTAAYACGTLLAAVPSGLLTAKVGVKATTIAGLLLLAVASIAFGFAPDVATLFAARLAQGCGSSLVWTGGFTWIVALAPDGRRGEVIGLAVAAAIAGTLLGPGIGALAAWAGQASVFLALAAPAAFGITWGITLPTGPAQVISLRAFRIALEDRRVVGAAALITPGSCSARRRHSRRSTSPGLAGAARQSALSSCRPQRFTTILNPMIGRHSDRLGRRTILQATLMVCAVSAAALAFGSGYWPHAAIVLIGGVGFSLLRGPATAQLSDAATHAGLDVGLGFALLNLAWPPGHFSDRQLLGRSRR